MIPSNKQLAVTRSSPTSGAFASQGGPVYACRHGSRAWRVVCLLAMISGCLALASPSALARQARLFAGTFGAASSSSPNPYPLTNPRTVAVDDSSHDVYVAEPYVPGPSGEELGGRVEKFTSSGEFILMFGKGVNRTKVAEGAPEAERDLCVAGSGDECGVGEEVSYSPDESPLEAPTYVAVDNSSGESKSDVYVATGEGVTAGSIAKFDSSGHLIASWGSSGVFDGASLKEPPSPTEGPFGELYGITVDTAGNLWISTTNPIDNSQVTLELRPDASFVKGWEPGTSNRAGLAIDSEGNLYFAEHENSEALYKFEPSGKAVGLVADYSFYGLAVNLDSNELYVDVHEFTLEHGNEAFIDRYDSTCHPTIVEGEVGPPCTPAETFGAEHLHNTSGLAVDPSESDEPLYVAENREALQGPPAEVAAFAVFTVPDVSVLPPSEPTSSSATLTGSVEPDGVQLVEGAEGCRFEWGEAAGGYEHTAPCEQSAAQIGSGSSAVPVSARVSGLQAARTYHYRLVAGNANDVNEFIDEPSISGDLAFGPPLIESESALAVNATSATLQADVDPNEIGTVIRFEYGLQAGAYEHSTSEVELGAGDAGQSVPVHVQGLLPGTIYHYRLLASNLLGTREGEDQTFTTQGLGIFSLPDGRAWELVSPPAKDGALIQPLFGGGLVQAAADGDALTYLTSAPTESHPAGNSNYTQVLSARGDASWQSRNISTPLNVANGFNEGSPEEYRFFSPDLSLAVVQPLGPFVPSISAEASERTPFLRTDYTGGDPVAFCESSCFRPLVTGAPGFANVPEGTEFGEADSNCRGECGPLFLGATADGSHVVLSAEAPLTEGAPASGLYEWAGGQLQLVSVLPDGRPASAGGSPTLGTRESSGTKDSMRGRHNALSADGSRVVWSVSGTHRLLYLRDVPQEETVELGGEGAEFQAASIDDARVFFTQSGDLYLFEAPPGSELTGGQLTDLTPGGAAVGHVLGASEDGASVYFVAESVLTGTPNPRGESATGGQPNLYVHSAGVTKFIATLTGADGKDWEADNGLTARVSPDGDWLAFMSTRSLTGYDNRDAVTGERDKEVFLYEAAGDGGEGELVCASCNPTGARPHGVFDTEQSGDYLLVDEQFAQGGRLAGSVPAWTSPLYQSRYLSDSGRLFFDSADALTPSDTNGVEDVYEWEPPGVGSCTSEGSSYSPRSDGCVNLISSGTSKEESAFLDASENGDDVFFLTSAQLTGDDVDAMPDIYDARVDGGFPAAQAPPACEGDACQSPATAPNDLTPDSLTFRGPGNPTPASEAPKKKKAPKCKRRPNKRTKRRRARGCARRKGRKHASKGSGRKRSNHKRRGRS